MSDNPWRAPNFTHKEVETLIYNLELKPELIKPAVRLNRDGEKNCLQDLLTVSDKLKLWEEIAAEINKVGESHLTGVVRSGADVKRKWNDLKSRVKNKADDIRKGKLSDSKTPLSYLEERVLYLIAKTSNFQGLNGALPPAYLHVMGRRKTDKNQTSKLESAENKDIADHKVDTEENTVAEVKKFVTVKQEVPKTVPQFITSSATMPSGAKIPIITLTTPLTRILEAFPGKTTNTKNLEPSTKSKENSEVGSTSLKDDDAREVIEMIYASQKELKTEVKNLKRVMIKISDQKRKRIEQENEKIQLKKMKLMLKCQKQGIDYDEFMADFL